MSKMTVVTMAALVLGATAGPAFAGDEMKKVEELTTKVTYLLQGSGGGGFDDPKSSTGSDSLAKLDAPSKCFDTVKAAKDAGNKSDAKVYSSMAFWYDTAKKDDKGDTYITLADVEGMCKRYEKAYVQEWAEAEVVTAWYAVRDTLPRPIEGMYASEAKSVITMGQACAKRVDDALAYGFEPSHELTSSFYGMPAVKLGEAKASYCDKLIDWGTKRLAEINKSAGPTPAEIEAKWKKVGMKGAKLKLFVENELNGGGFDWYAAGCQTVISDPKKLAKAKKLFMWTAGANGGTLVTKIVFKGNKYKETSREFFDEAKAYRFCK